uniref:GTD-binding domain-containing protein n=1 Tax=Brassica campestris TaxID=3711 RepID=M4FC68_BRACM
MESRDLIQCCDCGCHHSSPRSNNNQFSNNPKVHIENECELLRQTVTSQQQSIQDLYDELEKERNAASSAADESMNVMQRLQHDKAELQMELRQYKVYAGEKMEHDLQEILALEEVVSQREQTILALECEAQGYKHRMMSYGITEGEANGDMSLVDAYDYDYEYPSLKCNINENQDSLGADVYVADDENYPPADSPRGRVHLRSLDQRISQIETNPSLDGGFRVASEKDDVFVESENYKHVSYTENDDNAKGGGDSLDIGDEMSDRVYTIDSGHHGGVTEQKVEVGNVEQVEHGDPDITKLYMRLQALEADRESMKEALLSMRTEKAQMVLLKELAQHLSKEVVPQRRLPLRKTSADGTLAFTPVFKVHVWDVNKQHGSANGSRKGPSITELAMSQEHTSVKHI